MGGEDIASLKNWDMFMKLFAVITRLGMIYFPSVIA